MRPSRPPQVARAGKTRGWALLLHLILLVLVARSGDPSPPSDTNPRDFSTSAALERLHAALSDVGPHPVGSPDNERVRQRWADQLAALGLPETPASQHHDRSWHTQRGRTSRGLPLANLVARVDGPSDGALLLLAHYDSTPHGPGANDDGVGVAVMLQVFETLLRDGPPQHPIILLLDDGEEAGLLGIELFLREHPWAADVATVINVEARGSRGPSLMFETSGHDANLIEVLAKHHPHPVSSSAFTAVYELMPNATDLTRVRSRGLLGVNFAHIHGASRYHTPEDSLEQVMPATVAHHGRGVLAMARGLLHSNLGQGAHGDAVFFDVLGQWIIRWPATWAVPIALVPWLVLSIAMRRQSLRSALLDGSTLLATMMLAAVAGYVWPLGPAEPFPDALGSTFLSMALTGGLPALLLWQLRGNTAPHHATDLTVWWTLASLGLAAAWYLPGVSYLLVAPVWLAAPAAFLTPGSLPLRAVLHWLPALAMTLIWGRLMTLVPVALGSHLLVLHSPIAACYASAIWLSCEDS